MTTSAAAVRLTVLVAVALITSACSGTTLPVEPRFDGEWRVSSLTEAGGSVDLSAAVILVEIDTETAAVIAETPCNLVLGSYTLETAPDGLGGIASFTLPGAGTADCDETDRSIRDAFVATAESVVQWVGTDERLVFTDPSGRSELVLTRVG
jgi:hypothetical protein